MGSHREASNGSKGASVGLGGVGRASETPASGMPPSPFSQRDGQTSSPDPVDEQYVGLWSKEVMTIATGTARGGTHRCGARGVGLYLASTSAVG